MEGEGEGGWREGGGLGMRLGETGNLPTHHLVLSECACLVTEKVLDPPKLFGDGAASDEGVWDRLVPLDHPRVHHFPHVQVHTKAVGGVYKQYLNFRSHTYEKTIIQYAYDILILLISLCVVSVHMCVCV